MKRSRLLFLFSLINLIAVFICIFFLPQNVVLKFNSNFVVTEMVSSWYDIILPTLQLISCVIIIIIDVKTSQIPHFYRYIVAFIAISMATFYTWIMIVLQFQNCMVGDKLRLPLTSLILIPIALFIMVYSHYQSSKKYCTISIFGYGWVKKNPLVWNKTHQIVGFNGAITSILLIVCAVVNDIKFQSNWAYLIAFSIWFVFYYLITLLHSIRMYNYYK